MKTCSKPVYFASLLAFITIGGEWFLMWQSRIWNGQDTAFRMFTVEAMILALLFLPEPELVP